MAESKYSENSAYLTGKLLMAMPQMGDQRFHRALIYICTHDANGAMGLVINNELPDVDFSELLGQLNLASDINIDTDKLARSIMNGGPVEAGRGFLLHSSDFHHDDTIRIDQNLGVTGTIDALRLALGGEAPQQMLFILGYAGWGGGQLESELQQNAWLVVDADPDIIFAERHEEKWSKAAQKLGIDPAMLSSAAGRA